MLTTAPAPGGRFRMTWRRALALAGIVAVVAGGVVAGHFVWKAPPPVVSQLVVTSTAIPAGGKITAADLRVVRVHPGANIPAGSVGPAAASRMIGQVAQAALPAGMFLARGDAGPSGALPGPAQALVGVALKPGQLPGNGLHIGEQVLVVALHSNSSGTQVRAIPMMTTTVWDVGNPDSSEVTPASIMVPARLATTLAAYAAQGDVVLAATDQVPGARPAPSASPVTTPPPHHPARPGRHRHPRSGH
jgi:hypothetical protein